MRIVIIGCGKVGRTLVEYLSSEGHDVVVVDTNAAVLSAVSNEQDVITVCGNGAAYVVQREAGVQHADLVIAVSPSDELNILCCLVARKLGDAKTIARVRNPDYSAQLVLLRDELGLSMTVNPEHAAASEIARMLRFPSALRVEPFARNRAELVEYVIPADSALCGMTLGRLAPSLSVHLLVCAVQRGEQVLIPNGDFILQAGDHIHVTTPPAELAVFFKKLGVYQNRVKAAMIVGGGRIAFYLAKQLVGFGAQVKIIESNAERCDDLCERLPKCTIVHGDGTNTDLLQEEGLDQMDAFVALTGIDEENLILSLYAGKRCKGHVIAKVDRLGFIDVLGDLGVSRLISPKNTTANSILQYVRAMSNSVGSNVETLLRLMDGRLECLEFRIRESAAYLGREIRNLPLKKNLLIGCIVRDGVPIIPCGSDTIESGDSVLVITTSPRFNDFNDIFETLPV